MYALNPNFKLFSLKNMMYLCHFDIAFTGHRHRGIVYRLSLSCISCYFMERRDEFQKIF
jgi:hypothetical protein